MKIKSIALSNFKQFDRERTIDFVVSPPEEETSDRTLILGDNGTGKSTILQAIALVTATASREQFNPDQLDWPGFDFNGVYSGRMSPSVKCFYQFSPTELAATKEYANWVEENKTDDPYWVSPSEYPEIQLSYDYQNQRAIASKGASSYFQFKGYQYAKQRSKSTIDKNDLFARVGNIYWYTEQRTSYSLSNLLDSDKTQQLDDVRSFLANTYYFHKDLQDKERTLREGQFDFFEALQQLYHSIFPNRSLVGPAPDFNQFEKTSIPKFFLYDGRHQYELAEMSAGERAIFPLLMDFARWNINHSIIIIDEIELHLHPPLQQALIRALPKLGVNNQFILTSHSDSVASMFSEEQIIRL